MDEEPPCGCATANFHIYLFIFILENHPYSAAHTYIDDIWDYLPQSCQASKLSLPGSGQRSERSDHMGIN